MAITPVDIVHTQFKTSFKGYNRAQVDEFVRSVTDALEEAFKEKNELQRRIHTLQDDLDRIKKIESAMTDALTLAQKSAEEVKAAAHHQAELILQEAEQARVRMTIDSQTESERYRADVALLQGTRDRFESEFKQMLSTYLEWLEKRGARDEVRSEVA
ncbi:MAG: DivIVA domain-containing protein [Armatimonadetes bacterium]|nr:DivIVA domain-containing protein [Armatimonadota bacterium]